MKMNNLLVLVFRRTKLENMLCRCGMVGTIHLPCKTGNAHPYLEMLGGQNFYFCIDVRPSSSECAQNHCLFLEDRSRGQFFDARSQTHNSHCHVNLLLFFSWWQNTSVPSSHSVIMLILCIMSWKMNYQEHQVVPLLSAKGLGKILDSEGIIEYFCQAIFNGKHNCRTNMIVDTFFCDGWLT